MRLISSCARRYLSACSSSAVTGPVTCGQRQYSSIDLESARPERLRPINGESLDTVRMMKLVVQMGTVHADRPPAKHPKLHAWSDRRH